MRRHYKYWPVLINSDAISSPAIITPRPGMLEDFVRFTPLPVNRFPYKLAPNVSNKILTNPSFCSFASFLIVLLTSFIKKTTSSWDQIIFMILIFDIFYDISLFEIISIVKSDPNIFFE